MPCLQSQEIQPASEAPAHKRLSEVLRAIAGDRTRDYITVGDLMNLMEGRARAVMIFLFAFPNVLPAPPGVSGVLGLPLLYLTSQMLLGRIPWLPAVIAGRGMPMEKFAGLVRRSDPFIRRAERLLRPRVSWMVSHAAEKPLGAYCLLMAVMLALPIPFGNLLPALAICLIALGVLERDGLWAIFGVAAGAAALLYAVSLSYALIKAVLFFLLG